jgi:hypothetical protein
VRPCLGQDVAKDLLHLVELGLPADRRRSELDDRVAAVVGAAVEPGLEQRLGKEAAQESFGFLGVERLARGLVLDQLDPVEVAAPRTSPTIGRSRSFSNVVRKAGAVALTWSTRFSRSKMSRFAIATADNTGDRGT